MNEKDKKLREMFAGLGGDDNVDTDFDSDTSFKINVTDEKTGNSITAYPNIRGGVLMASQGEMDTPFHGLRLAVMGQPADILLCYFSIQKYFRKVLVEKMGEANVRRAEAMAKKLEDEDN